MTDTPTLNDDEVRGCIIDFIHGELLPGDVEIGVDDELLTGEVLDSLAILRLATFVDETFAIGMQPSDFVIENFGSVRAITDYVMRAGKRVS